MSDFLNPAYEQPPVHTTSRKRKRAAAHAPSPGASLPGENADQQPEENGDVISSRHDILSREKRDISRVPVFTSIENSSFFQTDLLPMNRLGFVYVPAGIKNAPCACQFRTIHSNPPAYRVSWEDRSPFIKVTKDGLGLLGDKGYRSARCNAPVREGKWYMEVTIGKGGEEQGVSKSQGSHVRLGWGRREAPINGPVGLDGYSYGYRDKTGERVTLSRTKPYGKAFNPGDVIGMYISLPSPKRNANLNDPKDPARLRRLRIPIDFKGQEYFESLDYPQSREMIALMDYSGKSGQTGSVPSTKKSATTKNLPDQRRNHPANAPPSTKPGVPLRPLPVLPGSRIAFFVNGESQGVAFNDLYDYLQLRSQGTNKKEKERAFRDGTRKHQENPFDDGSLGYYPFISLFNYASVTINPGPDFAFPPPHDIDAFLDGVEPPIEEDVKPQRTWRPLCERYNEYMEEQWALDEVDEHEAMIALAEAEQDDARKEAQKKQRRKKAPAPARSKKGAASPSVTSSVKSASPQPFQHEDIHMAVDEVYERPASALGFSSQLYEPSPLRNGFTEHEAEPETSTRYGSPASVADETVPSGAQSGYNSEPVDDVDGGEPDMDDVDGVDYHQEIMDEYQH